MLGEYAEFYAQSYGAPEPIAELCPFILQAFLQSDRSFLKARRANGVSASQVDGSTPQRRGGRRQKAAADTQSSGP
jgi:hypothetical protein